MEKLFLVASPILCLVVYVAVRLAIGRPLSRWTLNVVVSLYLSVYLLVTSALGFFWVSQIELPKFDWHYLFGYFALGLAVVHVALQLRVLRAFFLKSSPRILVTSDRKSFRKVTRLVATAVLVGFLLVPLIWLVSMFLRPPKRILIRPETSSNGAQELRIRRKGITVDAIDYMYEESSYERWNVFRRRKITGNARPPAFKEYYEAKRIDLPSPAKRAGIGISDVFKRLGEYDATKDSERWTLQALSSLLFYSAGVTGKRGSLLLRAAASAAALYPTNVYVAAWDVEGLERGVYYYNPRVQALFQVRGANSLEDISRSTVSRENVEREGVKFILTSTFARTESRYGAGDRAYRYVAIDAGHVAANLALASTALNRRCDPQPIFDDANLAKAMGVDLETEGPMLVFSCDVGLHDKKKSDLLVPPHALVHVPSNLDNSDLTQLSLLMTSWRLLPGEPERVSVSEKTTSRTALPALLKKPVASQTDIFEVIRSRRTYRDYALSPVAQEDLSGVLQDASNPNLAIRHNSLIELTILVRSVVGLNPGVYRYLKDNNSLELIRDRDPSGEVERVGLSQELLGRAGFVIAVSMRTDKIGEVDGPRGYRHANLEVGRISGLAYLSAVGRNLGICGAGAFYDDEVRDLIAGKERHAAPLLLIAVGNR